MTESTPWDCIVIGGGIVGASVAYFASESQSVLLVEAETQPGYHATGRSAALFTEAYGPPQVRALTRASRSFFDAPPTGFAGAPLLHPRGTLFVGAEAEREDVLALHQRLRGDGLRSALLDGAQARALVPVLREEAAACAVHDPDAFDVDVHALLQGFLRGLRARGGQVITGARVERLAHDGALWQVRAESGAEWCAASVVNAAGAWADEVAARAGLPGIGIEPRRRSAFLFAPAEQTHCQDWPAVVSIDESWYFKPDAGLLLGSPANADPVPPHDVVAEEFDVALGIHRIEQATTLEIRRPRSTWAGLRSFVADGEPVCGFDARAPGFFWAAALGGYGIQSSPGFGRLCAALLRHEAVPADIVAQGLEPEALSPTRRAVCRTAAS